MSLVLHWFTLFLIGEALTGAPLAQSALAGKTPSVEDYDNFLSGSVAFGHAVAGLFFLRFFTKTKDRLFLLFCLAFWLLGSIRVALLLLGNPGEGHYLYWIRLAAYLLILVAIVDKNLRK
jgi:hypothetical protein